jgi:hypothetical protein
MSLKKLLNVHTVAYQPYTGQNKATGGQSYGTVQNIKGRFGEATTRFDTQEAIDQVADASFTSFELLTLQGRVVYLDKGYSITDIHVIRKGGGAISHYNYTLKSLDNSDL